MDVVPAELLGSEAALVPNRRFRWNALSLPALFVFLCGVYTTKDRTSVLINSGNLGFEHGRSQLEDFQRSMRQDRQSRGRCFLSGNQFSRAFLNVSERTKAINLQLEDKLIGIERLSTA